MRCLYYRGVKQVQKKEKRYINSKLGVQCTYKHYHTLLVCEGRVKNMWGAAQVSFNVYPCGEYMGWGVGDMFILAQ